MMTTIVVKEVLDTSGLSCPLPLLKTKQALVNLNTGDVLKVIATDAGSQRDFRSFAKLSKNELLHEAADEGVYSYWLKKGE